jgi:hypothetical protein
MKSVPYRDGIGVFVMWHLKLAAIAAALTVVALLPAAPQARADSPAAPKLETQAVIKRLGFGISRITLPPKAALRLDIHTAEIGQDAAGRKFTPYSSVMYDLDGDAWVYTVPAQLSFVRESVVIEQIKGGRAYLKEGPPAGTLVVTVGVPELYGTEIGVNGE